MPLMPFLRSSAGIHAKVDPVRLRYDPETGVQLLAQAVNVDVDQAGRISRRKGKRRIAAVSTPHSLWSTKDEQKAFLISGDSLFQLAIDGTLTLVKNGLESGIAAYFCEIGHDIYFSNGVDMGIIRDGETWEDWVATPYVGPDTNREFSGPLQGTILAYYRGRIMIADNANYCVWYSERLNYGCFDLARNFFMFGGEIQMVSPLDDGVLVSDDKAIYLLAGHSYGEFEQRKVLDSPAVPGSAVTIRSEWINPELQGTAVCFVAEGSGVCVALNSGEVLYLTKDRVDLPRASHGFGVVNHNDNHRYIVFMEI